MVLKWYRILLFFSVKLHKSMSKPQNSWEFPRIPSILAYFGPWSSNFFHRPGSPAGHQPGHLLPHGGAHVALIRLQEDDVTSPWDVGVLAPNGNGARPKDLPHDLEGMGMGMGDGDGDVCLMLCFKFGILVVCWSICLLVFCSDVSG